MSRLCGELSVKPFEKLGEVFSNELDSFPDQLGYFRHQETNKLTECDCGKLSEAPYALFCMSCYIHCERIGRFGTKEEYKGIEKPLDFSSGVHKLIY
jgi:hypothetical protein